MMKYPNNMTLYCLPLIFLVTCVLYGCVSSRSLIESDHLIINKVPSQNMHIDYVYVGNVNRGTVIYGTARFNRRMLGTPSDHLVVTITDHNGKVLDTAHTDYYRVGKPNKPLDIFSFSLTIPKPIPNGSIKRLKDVKSS